MSDAERWAQALKAGFEAHGRGEYGDAEASLNAAIELSEAWGFEDPRLSTGLIAYATNDLARGELEAAQALLLETAAALDEVVGAGAASADLAVNRATCQNNLGLIARRRGESEAAREHYQRALQVLEPGRAPGDRAVAAIKANIAALAMERGDHGAAELLLREVLEAEVEAGLEGRVPMSLNQLAVALIEQDKLEAAEELFQEHFGRWRGEGWPRHPAVASLWEAFAELKERQGKPDEAERSRLQAERHRELLRGPEEV